MIGNPRRGGLRFPTIGTKENSTHKKDATTINPIMAMPVRAIETSIATIDLAFISILLCSINGIHNSNGRASLRILLNMYINTRKSRANS